MIRIIEGFIGILTNIAKTKMRFVTRIASFVSNGKEIVPLVERRTKKREKKSKFSFVEKYVGY